MNPLEQLWINAIECASSGISKYYDTQSNLIIHSLNRHLSQLESSYKKEKSSSILRKAVSFVLEKKSSSSELTDKQKTLLNQIDRVFFCISQVSKLNSLQKSDILDTLYEGDMKQCINKIIKYVKSG